MYNAISSSPDFSKINSNDLKYTNFFYSAYSWASKNLEHKDLKNNFIEWYKTQNNKEIDLSILENLEDWRFLNLGVYAWILNQGGIIPEKNKNRFRENIDKLTKITKEISKENENKKIADPEKIYYLIMIDTLVDLDELEDTGIWDENSIFDILKKRKQTSSSLELLKDKFKKRYEELTNARSNEYFEYFEKVSDQILEEAKRFCKIVLSHIETFDQNKKSKRKVKRTFSEKRIEKKIKNIKFKKEDNSYHLNSIDPVSIVGAEALLVFNTKTRKIGIYYAEENNKLEIKGSTLQNYDKEKSISKILRKPEEHLPNFRTATLKRINVLFDYINGKKQELSGRINSDIILLKKF